MQIPDEWTTRLNEIRAIVPGALMAGGCLRDLDNERPVKDIDVFVRGSTAEQLIALHEKLEAAGFECEEIDASSWYPVGDGNDVVGFFEIHNLVRDYPVQVIMVDFPLERLPERFDFGICRIVYDGLTLTKTAEYEADKAAQVFQLRRQRTDQEMVASVHRYARLVKKYDGWRFALLDQLLDDDLELI